MTRVRIYPGFRAYIYSFYIQGLRELFGPKSLTYSLRGFEEAEDGSMSNGLPFLVEGSDPIRVFIDGMDAPLLFERALNWADVYGKVNLDPAGVPENHRHKVVPIGPHFGVRIWGIPRVLGQAVSTYLHSRKPIRRARMHFQDYWSQSVSRVPISAYTPQPSSPNYVFFTAWPWPEHPKVNPPRAQFIRVCRSVEGIEFEGGFAPRQFWRRQVRGYEDLTAPKRYPIKEYVEKIKRSAIVYNTPAVHACLGWKLGEFLALGKAIISLPLTREMPAPLLHGVHAHFVDGSDAALRSAIELLRDDLEYRRTLELGAAGYYATHLTPTKVLQRLLPAGLVNRT